MHGFGFCRSDSTIPIEELDYKYIGSCKDVIKLEKILKILRSGEEGTYPDLISFTEKQLHGVCPESKLLEIDNKEKCVKDLNNHQRENIVGELKSWTEGMADAASSSNLLVNGHADIPPVRIGSGSTSAAKNETALHSVSQTKGPALRTWEEWAKMDKEIENHLADDEDGKQPAREKNLAENPIPIDEALKQPLNWMGSGDRNVAAVNEKNKGNEAFRAGDFEEALVYYNRSLSISNAPAVHNNRAMVYIKLKRFREAVGDCDIVIESEPENIKAYMRRGIAKESLDDLHGAMDDFDKVIQLEPTNKRGKELHASLQKKLMEQNSEKKKRKRIQIEEISSSDDVNVDLSQPNAELSPKYPFDESQASKASLLESGEPESLSHTLGLERLHELSNGSSREAGTGISFERAPSTVSVNTDASKHTSPLDAVTEQRGLVQSTETVTEQRGLVQNTDVLTEQRELVQSTALFDMPKEALVLKDQGNDLFKSGSYSEAMKMYTRALHLLQQKGSKSHRFLIRKGMRDHNGVSCGRHYPNCRHCLDLKTCYGADTHYRDSLALLLSNRAICQQKIGDCRSCIADCDKSLDYFATAKTYLRRAAAYEALEKYEEAYLDYQTALSADPSIPSAVQARERISHILRTRHGPNWRTRIASRAPPSWPGSQSKGEPSYGSSSRSPMESGSAFVNDADSVVKGDDHPRPDHCGSSHTRPTDLSKKSPEVCQVINEGDSKLCKDEKTTSSAVSPTTTLSMEQKVDVNADESFEGLKNKGNRYVQQGQYVEAVEAYTKCIRLQPTETSSYTNRALCYLKLNEPDRASDDCSFVLKSQPENVKALFRRALARKAQKQYKECLSDLQSLLKLEPSNSAAKKELAAAKDLYLQELRNIQAHNELSKGSTSAAASSAPPSAASPAPPPAASPAPVPGKKVNIEEVAPMSSTSSKLTTKSSQCPMGKSSSNGVSIKPELKKVTAYEFMKAWNGLKTSGKSADYAHLLKQIDPQKLPDMLSNKLDADILKTLLSTIHDHFTHKETFRQGMLYLKFLSRTQRFGMTMMFLTDKVVLKRIFDACESRIRQVAPADKNLISELASLRSVYKC